MKIYIIITLSAVKNLDMMTTYVVNVAIHLNTQIQYVILICSQYSWFIFFKLCVAHASLFQLTTCLCFSLLCQFYSTEPVLSTPTTGDSSTCCSTGAGRYTNILDWEDKHHQKHSSIRCKTIHNLFAPVYLHIQVITSLKQQSVNVFCSSQASIMKKISFKKQ